MSSGVFQAADEVRYAWQGQPVVDLQSASLVGHYAGFAQYREVPRHGGPAEADGTHEFTDTLLAACEFTNDGDAGGVADRLEDLGGGRGG